MTIDSAKFLTYFWRYLTKGNRAKAIKKENTKGSKMDFPNMSAKIETGSITDSL
jgi:hypothetical protein